MRRSSARWWVAGIVAVLVGLVAYGAVDSPGSRSDDRQVVVPNARNAAADNTPPPPPRGLPSPQELAAAGRVSVSDANGNIRGTIAYPIDYAKYNGLIPVTDASGNVVGYMGDSVGFIEKATAEAPGFDLAALQAKVVHIPSAEEVQNNIQQAQRPSR
jgi:hypothetical protein